LSNASEQGRFIWAAQEWVNTLVVGMNLCPFAKRELVQSRVRFAVTEAATEEALLMALQDELELLASDAKIETTLLIHPYALPDFLAYNQFLDLADSLLAQLEVEGLYQVASFHPDYQFGGTAADDAENYTNRSPFPMLHLLREESLERAIADYPDVDQIPERNIRLMNSIGADKLKALLQACTENPGHKDG
jgi:hypothetical protein